MLEAVYGQCSVGDFSEALRLIVEDDAATAARPLVAPEPAVRVYV